jgi:hypothetical protein
MPTPSDTPLWLDPFHQPDADALAAGVASEEGDGGFAEFREALKADMDLRESLGWWGIPWRWTLAYAEQGTSADETPTAFLIPEPGRPQFALPIPVEAADPIAATKLHRTVKEPLGVGKVVGPTLWAEWDLATVTRHEDLIALVKIVREHTGAPK